jgi:hypothetical protein
MNKRWVSNCEFHSIILKEKRLVIRLVWYTPVEKHSVSLETHFVFPLGKAYMA